MPCMNTSKVAVFNRDLSNGRINEGSLSLGSLTSSGKSYFLSYL